MDENNFFEKCVLELRALVFFYWTQMEKHVFIDWSEVNRMFCCGEIVIFLQRMMILKNASSNFVEPPRLNWDR